jgi:hypothetical protein
MSSVQRDLRPVGAVGPSNDEQDARRQAIEQIERKRKFWYQTLAGGVGMLLLAAIWAITEYQNSGGWPTKGFSESSGIPHVWNMWIIYPVIAWVFFSVVHGISVYMRKPVTESEIRREMERRR